MSLADTFSAPPPIRRGPLCSVGKLTPEDQTAIADAIARGWALTDIGKKLREQDIAVGAHSLGRHFRGQCGCNR